MFKWVLSKLRGALSAVRASAEATDGGDAQSEFTAEVVRITSVQSHPQADRLEIAGFEMLGTGLSGYTVVVGKGEFQIGQTAVYFSVDCLLPTAHPDFAFLLGRLDGAGKELFRLKAARLRGVFSQGLLVKNSQGLPFGAQCAETYGVSYYRAPEPDNPNGPNAPSSKKRPQPMMVYGVDSLKKNPRLFEEGEPVFITEKIHGCNFRFGWVRRRFLGIPIGWRFVVGSHRAIKDDKSGPGFYKEDLWTQAADHYRLAERTKNYRGFIFYGELYGYTFGGAPIQDLTYSGSGKPPMLAIFDVRDQVAHDWLAPFERLGLCDELQLPHVPILNPYTNYEVGIGMAYEGERSEVDKTTIKEGVVIENLAGPRRKAKFVLPQYLMRKGA